jgi:putative hydrolase of the HAD superfamily
VLDGFRRLGWHPEEADVLAVLDAYASAVAGWALLVPGAVDTLQKLRQRGYRLGLLSNTWWAAEWHNADLAAHGLRDLLDEVVYTSDLPHSKPHPSVFAEVASRLGVEPRLCVMVGDRQVDDVSGGLRAGMRAIWVRNDRPWPRASEAATAEIDSLTEIPPLLRAWGGA